MVSGGLGGRIWDNVFFFSGLQYPMYYYSEGAYTIPVVVKYKGVVVARFSPSKDQPSPGTWG